ncbi:ALP1-like protein [Tanacetum coccineum]
MDIAIAFFGVSGWNTDIHVLHQSPLFNDLKTGRAPEIPFVANGVTYLWGYYLVDGIYPELLTFAKTIPITNLYDHNRILYKQKQEAARKDVERAFDKGKAISPDWYPEEAHQPEDPERSDEQRRAIMRHIRSAQAHQNLRADLVEHLSRNA